MTFRALRERVNLSCSEVSAMIGIQESSYKKYEKSVRVPKANTIVMLRNIYNCTDEEIMSAVDYHTKRRSIT